MRQNPLLSRDTGNNVIVDGHRLNGDGSNESGGLEVSTEYRVTDVGDDALHCFRVLEDSSTGALLGNEPCNTHHNAGQVGEQHPVALIVATVDLSEV